MPINGTIINYFIHCKRQCYMHYNRINMEDESELVKIGKAMHEEKKTDEITVENIKVDKIKKDYLIENLYSSIETLTTKQKRRVISYYFNDESIEEIAMKEHVSESAIRKSIHQSLIQLKRKLNKYK